jgi:beta-phosphoglucomutase
MVFRSVLRSMVGHDTPHILAMLCELKGIDIPSEVIALRRARYRELQQQGVAPFAPMVAWVRQLASEHAEVYLALASSASQEEIQVNLQHIGLDALFEVVVSGRDDLAGYLDEEGTNKPKPYIYLEAAKRLGLSPAECLVFEDTAAGVQAAVGAGMRVIAVPNSYTREHDFSGAEQVLATTAALQQFLD